MTEKLIHCPKCNSENLDNSVYCCQCGSPMRKGIPARIRKSQWIAIVTMTLILSFLLTTGIHFFNSRKTNQVSSFIQNQEVQEDTPTRLLAVEMATPQPEMSQSLPTAPPVLPEDTQEPEIEKLIVGNVAIINQKGNTISEFPAAVVSGSWLALPARSCIGGNKWIFKVDGQEAIPIEGGIWGNGDVVGFWRLAGDKKFQGPYFASWQQEAPVRLLSIETGLLSEPMLLNASGVQGAFIYSPLSNVQETGVFMQNGKVVGWSFGNIIDGAYMWTMGPETNLLYENYIDDFYNETFAGGREEYFSTALSLEKDSSPQQQLQMFTEGFWFPPKLKPEDTPSYLRAETVYPYISKLVNYIMDQGGYQYIASLAEEQMLWEIRDTDLLLNVIQATQKIYGPETAVNFIEGPGADLQRAMDEGKTEVSQFHLELYLEWIKYLLANGEIVKGWQIYNRAQPRFSDSPELHLLAVELALAGNNWAEAESTLYQREYPVAFREMKMLLAERISDLKGQANKIIIRFQAGSTEIPIKVTVNESFNHNFLVDTGASFVTIPYSTVKALGLQDNMSQHQQEVQTAGGIVNANSVILSSIELQGWIVTDVKALVIDLPNRPGLGLLGLNYLNRFRMDLQADVGLLTLEPK